MGGGSAGSSNTTQTSAPWEGQQPYLEQGFQEADRIYGEGPSQYYPGQTYTDMSDPTLQGLQQQTSIASGPNQIGDAATNYATNTLTGNSGNPYEGILNSGVSGMQSTANGDYLTNNPYLDSVYNTAAGKVTQNFNEDIMPALGAQFGTSGMTGSTGHELYAGKAAGEATDSLGDLASSIYGGNYQQERDRQTNAQTGLTSTGAGLYNTGINQALSALGMSPALRDAQYGDASKLQEAGTAYEGQAGKALEDDINRYNYNQNADTASLQDYLSMISGNYGSTSTSRTSSGGSGLATGLGAAASLLSLFG